MDIFTTNLGLVHTFFGIVSMASGAMVIALGKGTLRHKKIGYVYFTAMVLLNVTGLFTKALYKFGPFHWLALASLTGIIIGIAMPVLFKRYKHWLLLHYYFMLWSYVGLIAAFFSEVIVRVPIFNSSSYFWPLVIFASVITYFVGGYYIETNSSKHLSKGN